MAIKEFELLPHTADLKIRAYGSSVEELFRNALKGMFTIIKPKGQFIEYLKEDQLHVKKFTGERSVHVKSLDQESLLIDFLSECLYLADVNDEAYFDAKFSFFDPKELQAKIYGTSTTGYEVVEIKAVTYHDMDFEQIDGVWQATIVFDI